MLATAAVGVRHVNRRTTRWMRAETWRSPGATYQPNDSGRTWLWSDLHLHHANIIRYCRRPFESVDEMDSALLRAWETTVDPGDTIICGGDVALARALDPLRLARLSAMPGRKVLVLGNHDFGPTGKPSETGSDEASMTLVIPGEPTLLVTHIPLWNVPAGRVNVHGHVHNHERLRPGPFINICVEQTGYRPLPWRRFGELAARRLDDPRPRGETTLEEIEQLDVAAAAGTSTRPAAGSSAPLPTMSSGSASCAETSLQSRSRMRLHLWKRNRAGKRATAGDVYRRAVDAGDADAWRR